MKRFLLCILLLSVSVFCEKIANLPYYYAKSRLSVELATFLDDQDSLYNKVLNNVAHKRSARDILGRLVKDTTIYVLREELCEKRIPVGIIDLEPRNKQDDLIIEFQKDQNGNKFVRRNGKKITLDEYHKIIQSNEISETNNAPFIRYESLTVSDVRNLVSGAKPVYVFLHRPMQVKLNTVYVQYSVIFGYTGVNGMHSSGAKGGGVGVFFEEGCPDVSYLNAGYFIQSGICDDSDSHATKVAKLLQLTAPEATIVNFIGDDAVISIVDNNANRFNPKLEIGSYSWHYIVSPCIEGVYCYADEELDQHIYEDRLIYFVAAGNMDDSTDVYVGSPGNALNAITVGAVHSYTGMYADYSKWKNSEIHNQKPEIANYTDFSLGSVGNFDGTSAATPYSAAIAANVLSADSDLKRHPEVIKSMFLMNASLPIVNGSTFDSDDWFAVSSKLPYFDTNIGFRYRWWSGSNASFFDGNEKIIFTETGLVSGQHCRAAISWLTSGTYAGEYKLLAQDLDLYVYQGSSTPIASSISAYNPFEVVDFTTQSNADLSIEIKRFANSYSDDVALGFTMRCDNE